MTGAHRDGGYWGERTRWVRTYPVGRRLLQPLVLRAQTA